jgi:hypothetical protein
VIFTLSQVQLELTSGGAYSMTREKRSTCRLLVGNPEGNKSLGRPRHWWVDNIKM